MSALGARFGQRVFQQGVGRKLASELGKNIGEYAVDKAVSSILSPSENTTGALNARTAIKDRRPGSVIFGMVADFAVSKVSEQFKNANTGPSTPAQASPSAAANAIASPKPFSNLSSQLSTNIGLHQSFAASPSLIQNARFNFSDQIAKMSSSVTQQLNENDRSFGGQDITDLLSFSSRHDSFSPMFRMQQAATVDVENTNQLDNSADVNNKENNSKDVNAEPAPVRESPSRNKV